MNLFRSRPWLAPVLLVGLALAVRLATVAAAPHVTPCCDAEDYIRHARSIAEGHGYPESFLVKDGGPTVLRAPVYPGFLGAVFALTGDSERAARGTQAALGAAAAGLIGLLAWQVFGRRRIALLALAGAAVYPPLVLQVTALLSEAVFLPLELASLCAAWQFRRDAGRWRWAVAAGVLAGLGALTRQTGVLLLIPIGCAVITAPGVERRRLLRAAALSAACAAVVVAPWTVRNVVVADKFIAVGAQSGLQMAGIYNEAARTDGDARALWVPPLFNGRDDDLFTRPGVTEVEFDRELRTRATAYARKHPGYVVEAVVLNAMRMLYIGSETSFRFAAQTNNYTMRMAQLDRLGFALGALLAVAGACTAAVRRVPLWFWLSPLPFYLAGAATAGFVRYRTPIDPFLLLSAAAAVAWLWDRVAPEPAVAQTP